MGVITREEFIAWWDQLVPENPANREDHPLWTPETDINPGPPSQWFVKNYNKHEATNIEFWAWCDFNLHGQVRCYMQNDREDDFWEWWGFTDQRDIVVWMLKWA